ncbi:AAA domain-containing protein [Amycolatopsis sp. NPDC004625]|uniref:AAA domain-containing protein n=1 Tax=Amycolatopsis sp. NPDC004625 TaxID=3154670 RepID=UPI0033B8A249
MSKLEMDRLVEQLFCGPEGTHGTFEVPGRVAGATVDGTELIQDTIFRYDLMDSASKSVTLQTYWDVSKFGGLLWDQEMRILLRAAATRHPALPSVVDGGYVEPSGSHPGFAYVITEGYNDRLVDDGQVIPFMRANPEEAVNQLLMLADALSILHSTGVVHRNIWPGTIDLDSSAAGELPKLKLSRFEMSRLVSDLLRSQTIDADRGAQARALFLKQGPKALVYVSPERLSLLYPDAEGAAREDPRSDVFSLGMLASEWFLGALPEPPSTVSDSVAVRDWVDGVQRERRRTLRVGTELPAQLADLLHDMTDPSMGARPSAAGVIARVNKHYQAMTELWTNISGQQPYLVGFQAAEFRDTVLRWNWITADPATNEGRIQLTDLIERDLHRAKLVHSPHGADRVVPLGGDPNAKREAQHVLVGERALWYCRPYRLDSAYGGQGTNVDEVLLIKYVVGYESERGRAAMKNLSRGSSERSISAVEAIPVDMAKAEFTARLKGRPSWIPLLRATRSASAGATDDDAYQQALDWLVEYQWVEYRARQYPYVRESSNGEVAVVRFDRERDSARRYRSALGTLYAESESRRPPFVVFFEQLGGDEDDREIEVDVDNDNEPGRSAGLRAFFVEEVNQDAFKLRVRGGADQLPEIGWLCPGSDRGTHRVLMRQDAARQELLDNRALIAQMREPRTIAGRRAPWSKAAKGLDGDGGKAVVDMLVNQPFFALQGPPGTGKTTVAAHAIAAYLAKEPGRVLISAQSNFALDNLAQRVLEVTKAIDANGRVKGESDIIPLRVASAAGADRVSQALRPFRIVELTRRRAGELRRRVDIELSDRRDDAALRLLGKWKSLLAGCEPELADRLRRSANLVFATCATATPEAVARSGASSLYDWVVVEEAAKAWPTELAIPLVRGLRWTLIGDHRQLPAHRRREVEDFLRECARSDNPDIAIEEGRVEEFRKFFDLFASLFESDRKEADSRLSSATRKLTTQYRMRKPIAEVVSRVFYPATEPVPAGELLPGLLSTGRPDSPAWPTAPKWLGEHPLIWLDTSGMGGGNDEPYWCNPAEADLVRELFAQLRPRPATFPSSSEKRPVAVLSPYRAQVKLLAEDEDVKPYVSTLHAFQGQQADVVIASMVRDTRRADQSKPWRNIGHLTQTHLLNVLLSRARDLLIVVGHLPHLENSGSEVWARLGEAIRRFGVVMPAGKVHDR